MRACEQIRSFIAYPNLPVKIIGGMGGFSGAIEGVTHMALEDIGMMRCIPNLVVLNPADAVAAKKAVLAAAAYPGPVYIRLGRDPSAVLFDEDYPFTIGKGIVLREEGYDAVLITAGPVTVEVLEAVSILKRRKVLCTAIEFPTLKPFDAELVARICAQTEDVYTVEEHSIVGGLGSAVLENLPDYVPVHLTRIGVPDCFVETGTPGQLRRKFQMTAPQIADRIMADLASRAWAAGSQRMG